MRIEKTFQATWNPVNQHLQYTEPCKARRVFWRIISMLPPVALAMWVGSRVGQIANKMTLPAAHLVTQERKTQAKADFDNFWNGEITEKNRKIREHFTMEPHTVMTPDGVPLSVKWLRHRDAKDTTPTVVYFCANFQLSIETPMWPLEKAIDNGAVYNFVLFDYRGVGDSGGKFTSARDLILDGASVVEWVEKELKTPGDQIHFYGMSLGGAIASLTHGLNPGRWLGRHVNERSFGSSDKIVAERFGGGYKARLINWIFRLQGYSANPSAAFKSLLGDKLIVYHPADRVIPDPASMQKAVSDHPNRLCLVPKPEFEQDSLKQAHSAPLSWHEGAQEAVVRFLFGLPESEDRLLVMG